MQFLDPNSTQEEQFKWWADQFPMRDLPDLVTMMFSIPPRMHGGILRYVIWGVLPGDFLTAVICNDLSLACVKADDENQRIIVDYVRLLHNFFPANSHGSRENMQSFMADGGMSKFKVGQNG